MSELETYSGLLFDPLCPDPDSIVIEDIAHALSLTNRWGGHTHNPFSVAQHSVNVSRMLLKLGHPYRVQLEGLMHDAPEAYIGDLPKPLKACLPDYQAVETVVHNAIMDKFGIARTHHRYVHFMDLEAAKWEYRDLLLGERLPPPMGPRSLMSCWVPEAAEREFLVTFGYLTTAIEKEDAG